MNDYSVSVIFAVCIICFLMTIVNCLTIYNITTTNLEPMVRHIAIQATSDFLKEVKK